MVPIESSMCSSIKDATPEKLKEYETNCLEAVARGEVRQYKII